MYLSPFQLILERCIMWPRTKQYVLARGMWNMQQGRALSPKEMKLVVEKYHEASAVGSCFWPQEQCKLRRQETQLQVMWTSLYDLLGEMMLLLEKCIRCWLHYSKLFCSTSTLNEFRQKSLRSISQIPQSKLSKLIMLWLINACITVKCQEHFGLWRA